MTYDTTTKPIPANATYALAKSLHHANACQFYLDMVIVEAGPSKQAKYFLQNLANKAKTITSDLLHRIKGSESKEVLKKELKDPLWLDSMNDMLIALNDEGRAKAEQFLTDLYNGNNQ